MAMKVKDHIKLSHDEPLMAIEAYPDDLSTSELPKPIETTLANLRKAHIPTHRHEPYCGMLCGIWGYCELCNDDE